jgi:hypothetical protein
MIIGKPKTTSVLTADQLRELRRVLQAADPALTLGDLALDWGLADESELFQSEFPTNQPLIWQSAPLYDAAMQKVRELWFHQFLLSNQSPSADEVLEWATNRSIETPHRGICMKRDEVETVSISQILKRPENLEMRYLELNSNEVLKTMLQTK